MDVFISWSGERSKDLAHALRRWLKYVVQAAEPWMSEEDIGVGHRWNNEVSSQLETTDFGVLCVTPENADSTWLHFEAGALAKSLKSSRVVPVLLGMSKTDLRLPLSQFQSCEANRNGTREKT